MQNSTLTSKRLVVGHHALKAKGSLEMSDFLIVILPIVVKK